MTAEILVCELECRADDTRMSPGRVHGVLLTYGARARDRAEVFEPGSLVWDEEGVVLNHSHDRRSPIMRFKPEVRGQDIIIDAPLPDTTRGRDAALDIRNRTLRGLSVEFRSLQEFRRGGVRRIVRARLGGAGLVDSGSYGNRLELRHAAQGEPGSLLGWL